MTAGHVTTVGPYTVELVVDDYDWHIQLTYRIGPNAEEAYKAWDAAEARAQASVARVFAGTPGCPNPAYELELADVLEEYADGPDLCAGCGARFAAFGNECNACRDRADSIKWVRP